MEERPEVGSRPRPKRYLRVIRAMLATPERRFKVGLLTKDSNRKHRCCEAEIRLSQVANVAQKMSHPEVELQG